MAGWFSLIISTWRGDTDMSTDSNSEQAAEMIRALPTAMTKTVNKDTSAGQVAVGGHPSRIRSFAD